MMRRKATAAAAVLAASLAGTAAIPAVGSGPPKSSGLRPNPVPCADDGIRRMADVSCCPGAAQ